MGLGSLQPHLLHFNCARKCLTLTFKKVTWIKCLSINNRAGLGNASVCAYLTSIRLHSGVVFEGRGWGIRGGAVGPQLPPWLPVATLMHSYMCINIHLHIHSNCQKNGGGRGSCQDS